MKHKCECGKSFDTPNGLGGHRGWCGRNREHINKIPFKEILDGKHPNYPVSKILPRLINDSGEEWICEICLTEEWMGKAVPLDLHHIDGDSTNHVRGNLQKLCSNCHAQTHNYKSKNRKP